MLSSVLRQLMVKVRPAIERAGFDKVLSDDRQYLAELYLPVFLADITKLLDGMSLNHPNQRVYQPEERQIANDHEDNQPGRSE
jgi:hypothetical protein